MSEHWDEDRAQPSVLGRLLVPQAGAKPAVTAFLLGVIGTGAFVASLVLGWLSVTVDAPVSQNGFREAGDNTVSLPVSSVDSLGLVYVLGTIALLGLLGAMLTRPDLALRWRLGATGIGVGLVGVVVATVMRLPTSSLSYDSILFGGAAQAMRAAEESAVIAYEPGVFCGFGAIVALVAAIWFAARPAARAAQAGPLAPAYPAVAPMPAPPAPAHASAGPPPAQLNGQPDPAAAAAIWRQPLRPGQVDELSVSASEPFDPSVTPESWQR